MDRLSEAEVEQVASGFGKALGRSIVSAARASPTFFDIISRPSMLPVVATIWDKIEDLQKRGHAVTSAILLEHYLQAIYLRKEYEIENDQRVNSSPDGANYLLLPREVREVFTLAVVWRMVGIDARNTVTRRIFDSVVAQVSDDVFQLFQKAGISPQIVNRVRAFEERYRDESRVDRLERISNEIASAGIFVPDPAGGPSNLRLPHKQFYEYLIAKAAWIILSCPHTLTAEVLSSASSRAAFENLLAEDLSLQFYSEIVGSDFSVFRRRALPLAFIIGLTNASIRLMIMQRRLLSGIRALVVPVTSKKIGVPSADRYKYSEEVDGYSQVVRLRDFRGRLFRAFGGMAVVVVAGVFAFSLGRESPETIFRLIIGPTQPLVIGPTQPRARDFLGLVGAFVGMIVVLVGAIATLSASISFPRLAVFRRIVALRMRKKLSSTDEHLLLLAVNLECLRVLSKTSSVVLQEDTSRTGNSSIQLEREFQNAIRPLG